MYWTTSSENTQKAYNDGLAKNDKGFDDNQSINIDVYTLEGNFIETMGSASETSRKYNVSKSTILRHCNREINNIRIAITFRFHNDKF